MREQCLQFWEIPDKAQTLLCRINANKKSSNFITRFKFIFTIKKINNLSGMHQIQKK